MKKQIKLLTLKYQKKNLENALLVRLIDLTFVSILASVIC